MSPVYVVHFTRDERMYDRLMVSEAQVVREILAGDDLPADQIHCIDRYDTDERIADNMTRAVAKAVARHFGAHPEEECSAKVRDFVETHAGLAYSAGLRVADRTFAAA